MGKGGTSFKSEMTTRDENLTSSSSSTNQTSYDLLRGHMSAGVPGESGDSGRQVGGEISVSVSGECGDISDCREEMSASVPGESGDNSDNEGQVRRGVGASVPGESGDIGDSGGRVRGEVGASVAGESGDNSEPMGRLRLCGDLVLIATGEPMYIPVTQVSGIWWSSFHVLLSAVSCQTITIEVMG